jgi:uncharacterized protein (TIGR03083 family)
MKLSPRYDGPSAIEVDGAAGDQAVVVRRQRRRLEALLTDLADDEWRAPSRCDGWSVHDVVAHLVGVNAFWEASVTAGLAGTPTRVLAAFDPVAHPPMMIEPMRALTAREVLDQFRASNDGFLGALAALDDRGWSTPAESPVGHVSIRLLAQHALWDAWIHERDIALPLGRTPALEPDEIASSLIYSAAVGPAFRIGDARAVPAQVGVVATDPDVHFTLELGDPVRVRHDSPPTGTPCLRGSAVELTEALSIRAPFPADAPPEWHELVRSLATVFDADLDAGA